MYKNNVHKSSSNIPTSINESVKAVTVTMIKVISVFSFFCLFDRFLAITVDPYRRDVIVSPHSASEVFFRGNDRQFLAPAPVVENPVPVAAPAAPAVAIAPAPISFPVPAAQTAAAAPLALETPVPVPVAAVTPVVAKVAQFKLSYPQYAYGYSVQDFTTGDNKVAKEVREGGIVKGSYSVADPDGTKRTVNYYADPIHGFNAVVHKTQILK